MKLAIKNLKNLNVKEEKFCHFLKKKIESYSTIIIHRHIHPDGDAYGAQFGLKYILEENWPSKRILITGKRETLKGMRVESFNKLNYIGYPDQLKEKDYKEALVIVVDTANFERIDGEWWNKGKEIIKIDHHPLVEKDYALKSHSWINKDCASCSQMIIWWALSQNLLINEKAKKSLYLGIITDTNRFLYINENKELNNSFLLATKLLHSAKFSLNKFYQSLYTKYTEEETRIKGFILSNFKIKNNLAYIFIKPNDFQQQKWKAKREEIIGLVNCLAEIENIKVWGIFVSDGITNNGEIRVSLRSRSEKYQVNKIAKAFGGGGHACAAGINLVQNDWKKAQKIIEKLEKL